MKNFRLKSTDTLQFNLNKDLSKKASRSKLTLSSICKKLTRNKMEYKLTQVFEKRRIISTHYIHNKTAKSSLAICTGVDCKYSPKHSMKSFCSISNCMKDSCKLKFRIFICSKSRKFYVYQNGNHFGLISNVRLRYWQIYNKPADLYSMSPPLESFNHSIIRTYTLKKRFRVMDFGEVMLRMARNYSTRYYNPILD